MQEIKNQTLIIFSCVRSKIFQLKRSLRCGKCKAFKRANVIITLIMYAATLNVNTNSSPIAMEFNRITLIDTANVQRTVLQNNFPTK